MQNQSFRVQVWASHENNAKAAELAQELRDRVRRAVLGSRAASEAGQTFTARTDGQGEHSFHFAIQKSSVNPVDDSETLVVEFNEGFDLCEGVRVEGFDKLPCRIDRGADGIRAVSFDHGYCLRGGAMTTTYTVGRHGVTAIRIERGARHG